MLKLSSKQLREVRSWNLKKFPFKAISDFSELKSDLRWENNTHVKEFKKNWIRRSKMSSNKNVFKYYKKANNPIDEKTWRYLVMRKKYYIMPVGWENIAKNGGNILDAGCGDGDVIQNLIDYIINYWKKSKKPKKIVIYGVDLNRSRIENAKRLVNNKSKFIDVKFLEADLTIKNFKNFKKNFFNYCLCTSVLEMLEPVRFKNCLNNLKKIVKKGLYISDLMDEFPGGYPRSLLSYDLVMNGFFVKKKYKVFTEPFKKNELLKPTISSILVNQNLYAEKK